MSHQLYRINDHLKVNEINDDLGIITSEMSATLLNSKVALKILKVISEAPITKDKLLRDYFDISLISEAVIAMHQLEEKGVITKSSPSFSKKQSAFWIELGYNIEELSDILETKTIAIHTIGKVSKSILEQSCTEVGLRFSKTPDLSIVLTDSYLNQGLHKYNKKAIKDRKPWLLIKTVGSKPMIGPLFIPEQEDTACWKCLEHRLLLHDQENTLYKSLRAKKENLERPIISHPLSDSLTANTAVLEIVSWLYKEKKKVLHNKVLLLDLKTGEKTTHLLVKRPQCSSCSNPTLLLNTPRPIRLKRNDTDDNVYGNYRGVPLEETLDKYKHHVSNVTGVVPFLKAFQVITKAPVYNFSSGKNLALQSSSMFWLNQHMRSANGGKGKTALQAKVGALCEAIERYSLMYREKTYTISASYKKLNNAIHPNSCMLYSDTQFNKRDEINKKTTKFYTLIPSPFDEEKIMDWTPVYNLTKEVFNYLPSPYCYAQYPLEDEKMTFSYPDSNGCAAGNTIEEAVLQGFLELVERDAAAIWWYNRLQRPKVNLESAHNPYIDKVITYYKSINRSLYALDITNDLNIPVFVAISHDTDPDKKDKILYAFGAHVDANIALERAIIELNQLLPAAISNKKNVVKDKVFSDWLDTAQLKEQPYLIPLQGSLKDMQSDYPKLCESTIYDSVRFCIKTGKENNLDTLVLDLTQPDIGLPVVKVIVPGIRHFWRRMAPGRLYDVPVKMGWLPDAYTESQLNPISIFL